jgi:site-specific recombinase XerD
MRHQREMDAAEVEAFLTMLATERHVSASTHNQALRALLFLYREALGVNLPWLDGVNRPAQKRRIPSVLTQDEVVALFQFLDGEMALLAKLLYGTGMRLMEGHGQAAGCIGAGALSDRFPECVRPPATVVTGL